MATELLASERDMGRSDPLSLTVTLTHVPIHIGTKK